MSLEISKRLPVSVVLLIAKKHLLNQVF